MTIRTHVPQLIILTFALNGVLCPCAASASQTETTHHAHHHERQSMDIIGGCHGMASSEACATLMGTAAKPDILLPSADCYKVGDPELLPTSIPEELFAVRNTYHGIPPPRSSPIARSTPVSRNDRLLD